MSRLSYLSASLPVVFFASAVAAVPTDPTITAPAILPRQNNDQFIGWVEYSGSWYSETCNAGLTWYQDGKYGQCCPVTLAGCYAPTGCISGSLIYPYPDVSSTRTIACTENFDNPALSICNTAFIFENMADSNPKTDIVCGSMSVNWSYYRKIPASATEVSSNAPLSIPQPASTALTAPNPTQPNKGGSSNAWIAGVVVGPIVGLAHITTALILFLRRRKTKRLAPQQGSAAMSATNPTSFPTGVGGSTEAKPQFGEQRPSFHADPYALSPTSLQYPVSPPPQQTLHDNGIEGAGAVAELRGEDGSFVAARTAELEGEGRDVVELRSSTSRDRPV